jgi:hypothetical protein
VHQAFSQTAALVRWSHTDLIDPQFGARLIGMNVVNRRHEADDLAVIDRHHQVVARVRQKLAGPAYVDWVVKDIRRKVRKDVSVLKAQNLDFYRHCAVSILRRRTAIQ